MTYVLKSYLNDQWVAATSKLVDIPSAIDGTIVARTGVSDIDFAAAVRFAREVGGKNLRALTFHQRADILKALATYL